MNTRQRDIVTLTERRGEISIKELAAHLGVSEMTIHRDLDFLQQQHYLYKKRGAAVFVENFDREKNDFYNDEKRSIGRKVLSLLRPGQSVIFDNSTTALECARFLDTPMNLTLYTTGIETAEILAGYAENVLYCSGGYYFPDSRGFVGEQAENFIASVQTDLCIIGTSGISEEGGLTTPYPMHTTLQKRIMASSKRCFLVADHSKFGKVAMQKFADLSEIDLLITDSGISDAVREEYGKYVDIVIA